MNNISFYLALIFDGVAYGSIYGLFALSLVLLYRANKLFNFAQTEIATLCVMATVFLMKKFSYFNAIIITIAFSFCVGCLLHFSVMRHITERKTVLHSSESLMTIGFFTIFNSLAGYIYGDEQRPFPSPFGTGVLTLYGANISYHSIGILACSSFLSFCIFLIFKHTKIGLHFEAVAENLVAARLRGIRASNVLALAWGFTVMISTIGGILMAPILFVAPSMLVGIMSYSLIAVVIGGLQSPLGAMIGGIVVGVTENLASSIPFIGSELKFDVVFLLLLFILVIRPRGLWGRAEGRRV